jgi:hypothetical protein
MDALHHLVLIKFRTGTPPEVIADFHRRYQTLAEECGGKDAGILHFKVEHNLDLRKGVQLVEFAVFRDSEALEAFRTHSAHQRLANDLSATADWQVGDYIGPVPSL